MILLINNAKPNMADLSYIKYIRNFLNKNNIAFIETKKIENINNQEIKGIIISGSPLKLSEPILLEDYGYIIHYLLKYSNVPVFGICFGCQILSVICSGFHLENQNKYLCETQSVQIDNSHLLFHQSSSQKSLSNNNFQFCFSDLIIPNKKLKNTREIAWFNYNDKKRPCAFEFSNHKYGTLFHPEFSEKTHYILLNFYNICLSIV